MRSRILFLILACICLSTFAQTEEAGEWREHGYNAWMDGDYETALDNYNKILGLDPEDYDARLAVASELSETSIMLLVDPTLEESDIIRASGVLQSVMTEATGGA